MPHEDYVNVEVAKLLKELGFDWWSDKYYGSTPYINGEKVEVYMDKHIPEDAEWRINDKLSFCGYRNREDELAYAAPTLEMAQKWVREVLNMHIEIVVGDHNKDWGYYYFTNIHEPEDMPVINGTPKMSKFYSGFTSYEEALLDALRICLINRKVITSKSASDWVTEANIEMSANDIDDKI